MLGKAVLLYTRDRIAARRIGAALRGAGDEVVRVDGAESAAELIGARAIDLLLVDFDAPGALEVLRWAAGRIPAVVLSSRAEPGVTLDLVCEHGVEHVLIHTGEGATAERGAGGAGAGTGTESKVDLDTRDVVVTAEKLLRGDLFGLDKYLPTFGVELASHEVRSAGERDEVVDCIRDHVEWMGAGREAARTAAAVADELITNAVYDAPRDEHGQPRYAAIDRRCKIELDPWEHVPVRWGSDGELLALSVTDWFGALRPEHVRDALRRCLGAGDQIEQKAGGAGLGLYTVFASASHLVINVDRGVRSEIIALVDLRRGMHGARRGGRSLHLFFDDSRARAAGAEAVPDSVEISQSLRIDLRESLAASPRRGTTVVPLLQPKDGQAPTRTRPARADQLLPAQDDPLGADTVRGLLRGARDQETALAGALRFLSHHYQVAVAYAVGAEELEPWLAAGRIEDWPRLRAARPVRRGMSTLVALLHAGEASTFRPTCPADYRLAKMATGKSDVGALAIPLHLGGEPRWVLWAAAPRGERQPAGAVLDALRADLESALLRVDPDQPVIVAQEG